MGEETGGQQEVSTEGTLPPAPKVPKLSRKKEMEKLAADEGAGRHVLENDRQGLFCLEVLHVFRQSVLVLEWSFEIVGGGLGTCFSE